jgi:hypothetical protein
MRRSCREHDVFWWQETFLRAARSPDAADPAPMPDYMPSPAPEP